MRYPFKQKVRDGSRKWTLLRISCDTHKFESWLFLVYKAKGHSRSFRPQIKSYSFLWNAEVIERSSVPTINLGNCKGGPITRALTFFLLKVSVLNYYYWTHSINFNDPLLSKKIFTAVFKATAYLKKTKNRNVSVVSQQNPLIFSPTLL